MRKVRTEGVRALATKRRPDPALPAPVRAEPGRDDDCLRVRVGGTPWGRVDAADWQALGLQGLGTVDAAAWPGLRAALERRAAYEHGLRLLAASDRSQQGLERRLAAAHGPAAAAAAVGRLAPYLDDERFACNWLEARQRRQPLGPAALTAGLVAAGVAPPLARAVVAQRVGGGADQEAQAEACRRALEARLRRTGGVRTPRDRVRLYAFLARRGFEHAVVVAVLRSLPDHGAGDGH